MHTNTRINTRINAYEYMHFQNRFVHTLDKHAQIKKKYTYLYSTIMVGRMKAGLAIKRKGISVLVFFERLKKIISEN